MAFFSGFKSEFGWSEFFSLVATGIAALAWFTAQSADEPAISLSEVRVRIDVTCDRERGRAVVRGFAPFRITNNGGRATSLIRYDRIEGVPPIATYSADGDPISTSPRLLIPELADRFEEIDRMWYWKSDSLLRASELLRFETDAFGRMQPPVINVRLGPGDTKVIALAFESSYSSSGDDITRNFSRLEINFNAVFSHGQVIPVTMTADKPFMGRGINCFPASLPGAR